MKRMFVELQVLSVLHPKTARSFMHIEETRMHARALGLSCADADAAIERAWSIRCSGVIMTPDAMYRLARFYLTEQAARPTH